METSKKTLSGTSLKIIACITMLLDHFGATILEFYMDYDGLTEHTASKTGMVIIYLILRFIGRLAFPLFIFLLIEGFKHTHSILKYIRNIAVFAVISELPFNLAMGKGALFYSESQSVMLTLLIGLIAIALIDKSKRTEFTRRITGIFAFVGPLFAGLAAAQLMYDWLMMFFSDFSSSKAKTICLFAGFITIVLLLFRQVTLEWNTRVQSGLNFIVLFTSVALADFLKTDYSGFGILAIIVMYMFFGQPQKQMLYGVLILTVFSPVEVFAFFDVSLAKRYNGERGISKGKYIFYCFYPAHLLIYAIICMLMGTISFSVLP